MKRAGRSAVLAAIGLSAAALGGPGLGQPAARPVSESERIKALPEEDRRWLTEFVAPIILSEERRVYLEMTEPYQREFFKADFWERRERDGLPWPLGPGYRSRYAELRRLADEKYDGWREDAGRMVLRWGEPDSILSPRCAEEEVFYDLEVWTYSHSGGSPGRHILYRPAQRAPRKIWTVRDEVERARTLEPPFKPNSCRFRMRDLAQDCGSGVHCPPCPDLCQVYLAYQEIRARQGSAPGAAAEQAMLFDLPKVSTEGLDRQKDRWAAASDPKAAPIRVEGPSAGPGAAAALASTPTPTPTPEPRRRLSDEEILDRILHLDKKYKEWLDLATPLLTREDLSLFLQLSSKEKDQFIRDFWKKRS